MFTKEDAIKYMREGGVVEFHLPSQASLQRRMVDGVHQARSGGGQWISDIGGMSSEPGFYRPVKERPATKKPFTREDAVAHMEAGGVVRWTVGVGALGAWLHRIVGGVHMARYESSLEWHPTHIPMVDGDDLYAPYCAPTPAGMSAKVVAVDEAKPASSWDTDPGQNPLEDIRHAVSEAQKNTAVVYGFHSTVGAYPSVGKKFDSGKPRVSLVPVGVVNALLRVHHEREGQGDGLEHDDPKLLDEVAGDLLDGDYADALYDVSAALGGVGSLGGLLEIVEVLEYGCKKYTENNWQLVPDAKRRYYDAAFRHLIAAMCGEERDPETGLRHLAHVGCNLVFLEFFKQKG